MPSMPPRFRPPGWHPRAKKTDPFYGTERWKKLRKFVRERDGGICRKCGLPAPGGPVDHIVARKDGGSDDPSNLRLLCTGCDSRRHSEKRTATRD